MRKFFLLGFLCLTVNACDKKPQTPAFTPDVPVPSATQDIEQEAVAQVGPVTITAQELDSRLAVLDEQDRKFAQTAIGRRNFIQLLAREKLIALDARDEKLDQGELYQSDLDDKRRQLAEIYQQYADQLLTRLWHEHMQQKGVTAVTEEEIAAYYKKYPYEMSIRQMIIPDAQTADEVYRALRRAKNRWKELERQYSKAPARSFNEEITFMPGEFIPELEVIAANSPVNEPQGFVKTAQGFHIIMKTKERRLSLKDAAPRIRMILEQQKTDAALNALQNKYKVVIYEQDE